MPVGTSIASPALRARVRRVLLEFGVIQGCRILGIADRTSARMAAGLPINQGSIALCEKCLDAYDRDPAAARANAGANAGANQSKNASKNRKLREKSSAA